MRPVHVIFGQSEATDCDYVCTNMWLCVRRTERTWKVVYSICFRKQHHESYSSFMLSPLMCFLWRYTHSSAGEFYGLYLFGSNLFFFCYEFRYSFNFQNLYIFALHSFSLALFRRKWCFSKIECRLIKLTTHHDGRKDPHVFCRFKIRTLFRKLFKMPTLNNVFIIQIVQLKNTASQINSMQMSIHLMQSQLIRVHMLVINSTNQINGL